MLVCRPPRAALSAGAMTSAKRIGVSIGTAIWRMLRAVRAARREASVRRARARPARGGAAAPGRRRAGSARGGDMGPSFRGAGGRGGGGAGEPQVDVIERGAAGADRGGAQPGSVERSDRIAGTG